MVPPQRSSDDGFIVQVTMFLGISVLAGVLVAGMLLPLAGSAGLSARASAESFSEPRELDLRPLAQRSRILAADGKSVIADLYDDNRVSVPLKAVAPIMRQAMVAIEDSRFYEHGGIDVRGTLRAAAANAHSGAVLQGGSTLTQQYVKNVLVEQANNKAQEQAAREKGIARKYRELQYAVQIEKKLTKDQILENYLNITYYGAGAYGIEAASRRYFSKSASKLTLPEAALLAGVVRSPSAYAPTANMQRATARRNTVLDRMAETKMITPEQAAQAKKTKVVLKLQKPRHGCAAAREAAWFCDYVSKIIATNPIYGKSAKERLSLLHRGGLSIVTTYDPKMQKAAQKAINKYVFARDKAAAAISLIEPGTGRIKAMAQSRPYTAGLNLNVDKQHGKGNGFQAGSTFKPFVAASALEQGMPVSTSFYAPDEIDLSDRPFKTCEGVNKDEWSPSNENNREDGQYNMAGAMEKSVNTYFAQLEERTGICGPKQVAERMGLRQADGKPLLEYKSFTLGTNPVAPLDMAEAYATFAARGMHCNAIAILSVTDRNGKKLPVPSADCKQVLKPDVADTMNAVLQGVIQRGTGTRAQIGRPAAGKTGTTNDRIAVWFVGYTPNLAAAVWAGSPRDYRYKMSNVRIGGEYYEDVCGGCLPGRIWRDAMSKAVADLPAKGFPAPSNPELMFGSGDPIPDVRGVSPDQAIAALQALGFQTRISGREVSSDRPPGSVAFTSPGGGDRAPKGTTVTIFISRGDQISFIPSDNRQGNGRGRGRGGEGRGNFTLPRCENGGVFPLCLPRE